MPLKRVYLAFGLVAVAGPRQMQDSGELFLVERTLGEELLAGGRVPRVGADLCGEDEGGAVGGEAPCFVGENLQQLDLAL